MNLLSDMKTWLLPGAVALGGLFLGLFVRNTVLARLQKLAQKSAWKYDDVMVAAVRGPVVLWFVLLGLHIALRILPLSTSADRILGRIALIIAIFSVTWALARFLAGALQAGSADGGLPGVSLIANVVRILVFTVGGLVILQTFGISITPIITALGVGGLAVGLALQDTLANFFAGIRILASGKLRIGDFVKLDSGEEGFIQDITWAQTTIRQMPNSLVIVPNAKIAGAIAINYDLPDQQQGVVVPVGVSYASDLEMVERVTAEVARRLQQESEFAVPDHEPLIRYREFGDSSINFNVILRTTHHTNRFPLISEFIKRLHARYAAEGIEIPFPQRDVHMKSGG